ncbi:MAG: DcaP family trimeric outer membrane transporter [Pseudomonadota bacterium]
MSGCIKRGKKSKLIIALMLTTSVGVKSVDAQTKDEEVEALRKEVQELRALVESLANANAERLESADQTDITRPEDITEPVARLPATSSEPSIESVGDKDADSVEDVLQAVLSNRQPIGRFPDDAFVTAGNFDRSISVSGTPGSFRVGGLIQINSNFDPDNQGFQFIGTAPTIPLDGDADDETSQFAIHARHTRVNFDYRAPTTLGEFRTFVEFDFFGDGDEFTNDFDLRLRHAAAELGPFKIGQFWSGFVDVFSFPETADPGGPLAAPVLRNPGIYYVRGERQGSNWGIGIENPAADLGGNEDLLASESAPNVVGFAQLERDWGHLRIAGLGVQLKSDTDTDYTGAVHVSGRVQTPFTGSEQNNISFATQYGAGITHYYSSFTGGLDGIIDDDGEVGSTELFGAFIGYQHFWTDRWRSTITGSVFDLDQPSGADPLSFDNAERVSLSLFYTPIDGVTLGLEGIYNTIETDDGSDGEGTRIEFVGRFDF